MSALSESIWSWLYTSQFKEQKTDIEISEMAEAFASKNQRLGLSGFLITNGKTVMQLLEGNLAEVDPLKKMIAGDDRHTSVVTEIWAEQDVRAYPNWSMRTVRPLHYESLFEEIESAKIKTTATHIARMVFDLTFDG